MDLKIQPGNMVISIEFLGPQRVVTNADVIDMPITEKTTVNDALEYLRRKYPNLHLEEGSVLITVNQEIASLDRVLKPNDTISFLPFVGGG